MVFSKYSTASGEAGFGSAAWTAAQQNGKMAKARSRRIIRDSGVGAKSKLGGEANTIIV